MKKIVCFLLAVSLMLSLSVFSFAESVPPIEESPFWVELEPNPNYPDFVPYSLYTSVDGLYFESSANATTIGKFTSPVSATLTDGYYYGSGMQYQTAGSGIKNMLNFCKVASSLGSSQPAYWWVNFVGKITDSNGRVLQPSDLSTLSLMTFNTGVNISNSYMRSTGSVTASLGANVYSFEDGYFQVAFATSGNEPIGALSVCFLCNLSNAIAPFSFEVEKLDFYVAESSSSVPPFTFGSGAHSTTPPTPEVKDPNDHTQYGSASDQVEWYNDAYGAAVDPELEDKMSSTTDMLLQEQEIEEQMIDGINQYAPAVNPANLSMPTQIVNGLSFIGTTFMSSYNALGDIGFVISFSMMLGVVLVLIGRGEGALARGMASSARERRRTEYGSDRDMKKGG